MGSATQRKIIEDIRPIAEKSLQLRMVLADIEPVQAIEVDKVVALADNLHLPCLVALDG